MKVNEKMCRLIAEIEYLIGSECYNPHSYDGWNGIEGSKLRYPINVPNADGKYTKVRGKVTDSCLLNPEEITPDAMKHIKYRFGANELMIGQGIIKTMEFLESRYGLDFNELEKNLSTKK